MNKPRLTPVGPHRPGKWYCTSVEQGAWGPATCIGSGYSPREAYAKWLRNTPDWQRQFGFRHSR